MTEINLAGTWRMKNCTDNAQYDAIIPGSDFGNLIRNNAIRNPLISGDEKEGIATGENDIEFSRDFELADCELSSAYIHLCCGGLDTLCTCYINGEKVFESNNAFVPIDIDVKSYLRAGINHILLHFASAVKYVTAKQNENPLPKNNNGVDGIAYLRKPACHFGWDWGPCVPYCAVTDFIKLKCFNRRIENIKVSQNTTKEQSVITVSADNADRIYLICPDGSTADISENNTFTVDNPELWYTYEMSQKENQPLYTVVFENDEDRAEKKIGLRSLYLDVSEDEYGSNFCFVLNGEKVFAKGGNLIPFSAIYEDSDNNTVDYYLDLAQKSNFNIIRVWGGGSYASEYFMNQCDERGILVWQDFCFACLMYPFYESDFTENVLREVEKNVQRLTMHPSLALWCGNNEIEVMFSYLPKTTKLMKSYVEFFYHTLPDFIKDITDVSYIPTSPVGSEPFKNYSSDDVGDTHMWSVWHGLKKLDYYTTRYSRFLSEFGLESLPSMRAIKTFASPEEYDIKSASFNRHQKCIGGNEKMLFYLTEMFDFPKSFEVLPYLTGIVQAECIKNATIHFRQNKGRCNGSIFWQYNDVWNCPSWSSVDFEGIPKALQYKAREFFAPVTFSCKKEKGRVIIFAHNDTLAEVNTTLKLKLFNPDYTKQYNVNIQPNSFKVVDTVEVSKKSVLQLYFNGEVITEIFTAPHKLNLKKANIKTTVDGNNLTLESDNFAYNVFIDSDEIPSDNYFSLTPGEKRTVSFSHMPSKFTVTCANIIEFKKSGIKKKLFRFFYRLKPLNIGNYFYYTFN
ncbi:MAG: hypothetical protein NC122_03475 [Faecalibacterium sp.]|nr:hypothetical protein [Ruminococcus sp.]MCM1391440.1 hypothetical protein [Ruminococcus sp.]MCM1485245.1 hypothetical protein [Faecalibacterium sp.]